MNSYWPCSEIVTRKREVYPNTAALKRLEKTGILTGSGVVAQNHQRKNERAMLKNRLE